MDSFGRAMIDKIKVSWRFHPHRIISILIGAVLLLTGSYHASRPFDFFNSVLAYQLVSGVTAQIAASVVPWLQMSVGLFLLVGVYSIGSYRLATLIFLVFALAQTSALIRGLTIDCGCFPGADHPVSIQGVCLLFFLILLALLGEFMQRAGEIATQGERYDKSK